MEHGAGQFRRPSNGAGMPGMLGRPIGSGQSTTAPEPPGHSMPTRGPVPAQAHPRRTGAWQMFRIVEQGWSAGRVPGVAMARTEPRDARAGRYRDGWPPSPERSSRSGRPSADPGAHEQLMAAETLQPPDSCSLTVNFRRPGQPGDAGGGDRARCGRAPTPQGNSVRSHSRALPRDPPVGADS